MATAKASGSASIAHPAASLGAKKPDNFFPMKKHVGKREPEKFGRLLPRQYDSTPAASRADAVADAESADNGTDAGVGAGQPTTEEDAISELAALNGARPSEADSEPQKQLRQYK